VQGAEWSGPRVDHREKVVRLLVTGEEPLPVAVVVEDNERPKTVEPPTLRSDAALSDVTALERSRRLA
jgi:hypothetical protein